MIVGLLAALGSFLSPLILWASSGTEGAAFLDIPVGAGPAAMGAAYSALAEDAYAPTLNPAGLGFLDSSQFAGQHLAYVDSIHYEYLSFGVPLRPSASCTASSACAKSGLGGSIQYLGTGDIAGTDAAGNSIGNFSSHYAAYNLSYGRTFSTQLSLGLTAKWINAQIADVSANAYAVDFGSLYHPSNKLALAAVLTNVGTKLTFLDVGDPLPLAFHMGAAYRPTSQWILSAEGVYPQTGLASLHGGLEWRPYSAISLRAGFRTDTLKELGVMAGFTMGLGVHIFGHEFSYAWVPLGDLGNSHYISMVLRFGDGAQINRNLIQYHNLPTSQEVRRNTGTPMPDYSQETQLPETDDTQVASYPVWH